MKLALMIFALVSTPAMADSMITRQHEVLERVNVDGRPTRYVGVLDMDFINNKIDVVVYDDICGQFAPAKPGTVRCMAAAKAVKKLNVLMQKRATSCGSKIYSGIVDKRRVDGGRLEITVTDNSSRLCRDLPKGEIVVDVKETAARSNRTTEIELIKAPNF